ncbi:protein diaphanous homolog 3 isoform X1 [Ictalurus furcatus]|uniref:protein diaphanous homolog 3 isoform X1 n=1 Tax=Ictalurus furcatus TaxID=66913 RepID=UPI00234FDD96|nr:protein diaphanous homolog 3 isoform X1 [Ictalurus furcatus]
MTSTKMLEFPQLSNEMQLKIMHKVKSGELSIDDALDQARRDKLQLLQRNFDLEEKQASQYNFSVHKYNSYIWQKRVFQIDFSTKMVCSIEKGIVKRQFSFEAIKNCHDAAGTRFTVLFKDHHEYELEAMSPQDKQKIMELINQIIYRNIQPADIYEKSEEPSVSPKRLHEGQLLLQRGGLASFKWKKYEAYLYTGHMTLLSTGHCQYEDEADVPMSSNLPIIIHFSDGTASVESHCSCDSLFMLLTNKNEFNFRIPVNGQMSTEVIRSERDAWVKAINKLCMDWKCKSQSEHVYEELSESAKIAETIKVCQSEGEREPEAETDRMQNNCGSVLTPLQPRPCVPVPLPGPVLEPVCHPALRPEDVPDLRLPSTPVKMPEPEPVPQLGTVTSPVSTSALTPAPPLPPPMPKKSKPQTLTQRTKVFHWDVITQDKIAKSLWARGSPREIEIDTSRLYEQFGVKDLGHFSNTESSNHVEILLNPKIAHNFNIFLKSFPVQPKELKDKLFIVGEGEGGLSDEHIASLRRYVPTPDDIEMYKSYKGDASELHMVDQYMMELCNIPYLSTRLDLLLTLRELPISIEDLTPLITQKIVMCRQLWGCESFVSVLEYLLTIGNYLNQHAGKEKAKGFRLSSLTKLLQLRGNEKKFTLLHALVEQIMLHEPCLATFFQELTEFETVPGASIKGLTAEVDVVKNELQKVIQYRKTYKRKNLGSQHSKFSKDLKIAIEKYEVELSQLTKRCAEMRKLYADILVIPELLFQYLVLCCPGRQMDQKPAGLSRPAFSIVSLLICTRRGWRKREGCNSDSRFLKVTILPP